MSATSEAKIKGSPKEKRPTIAIRSWIPRSLFERFERRRNAPVSAISFDGGLTTFTVGSESFDLAPKYHFPTTLQRP